MRPASNYNGQWHNRHMTKSSTRKTRLSGHDWLGQAMEVLSREGGAKLNVDDLCQALGVTKGSFYAHFENRADFVEKFVAYWAENFTRSVVSAIDELDGASAEVRLLTLMRLLHQQQTARYDIAVRAWAAQEPVVAEGVQEVDRQRFAYIRQIFHDMGFRRADLDFRTRLFVVYHSLEAGMRLPPSGLDVDKEIRLRHAFFTRR